MTGTATNVGNIVSYMNGAAAKTTANAGQKNEKSQASASFDNILNQVSDTVIQTKTADASNNQIANKDIAKKSFSSKVDNRTKTDSAEKARTKDDNINNAKADRGEGISAKDSMQKVEKAKTSEEVKEAIEKAGEEIAEEISEVLDITEEDLINIMQLLGLTFADLLNPENLQQLVTAAGGQEQALDLITDSDIYTSLQDLMEGAESMKSELMNEFNLSEEDFETIVAEPSFKETFEAKADISNKIDPDMIKEAKEKVDLDPRPITDQKEIKAPQSEGSGDIQITEEKELVTVENTGQSSADSGKQNFQNGSESANLFNQIVNNIVDAAETQAPEAVTYTDRAQMENIIRQITEKITIAASENETTMELQLHPASLGNVNIMLTSSKDGIVAKFTAQNEIVKEAVESQMMQLQQKFNEQGIKITSIEVTIASHAFEQNLQQQDQNHEAYENNRSSRKGLRRINLVDIGEEEEQDMTEAERIAAQMMAMNGNTIDFSA